MTFLLNRNKTFRPLFWGRFISNAGDTFYAFALMWYFGQQENSLYWISLLTFAMFVPYALVFIFGFLFDYINKKHVLVISEIGQGIVILAMAILVGTQTKNMWLLIFLDFLASLFVVATNAAQDGFIPEIAERKDFVRIQQYLAFSYSAFSPIAGLLLTVMSPSALLYLDALTFVGSVGFFAAIPYTPKQTPKKEKPTRINPLSTIRQDLWTIVSRPSVLILTLLVSLSALMMSSLGTYQITITSKINDALFYGLLGGAAALGQTLGSTIVSAWAQRKFTAGQILIIGNIVFGAIITITLFASDSKVLFLIIWLLAYTAYGAAQITPKPFLQETIDKKHLGSFFTTYNGLVALPYAFGGFVYSAISPLWGPSGFIVIFGVTFIAIGCIYMCNKAISHFKG